ncbi:MAG: c-type cytochrome [Anaerolineales bacterium]
MKQRLVLLVLLAFLFGGCNLSLAEDITPPPDYRSPTPPPTLGPLYPAEPPDVARGAAIYAEKCAACHGERGLGDGPQGKQLPVRVSPLGLPEIAQKVTPAQWFTVVTQGNLERFMPPFMSLSAQERWDVVAYALTLHTSPEEVEEGRQLFERLCSACDTARFRDQERMAALSNQDLFQWVRQESPMKEVSEAEAWKVVAYLRSLSFANVTLAANATPETTPTPAAQPATEETPTPMALEGTPAPATQLPVTETPATGPSESEATPAPGLQVVSGQIEAAAGTQLPSPLQVTLHGYDHEPNTMPVETVTLTATVSPDGSYRFEGVEMPVGRIFRADVNVGGVYFNSPFAVVEEGQTELQLEPIRIQPVTEDFTSLRITQTHIQVDVGEDQLQVFVVYSILNEGEQVVRVRTDGTSLPFIRFPDGATQTGLQLTQDSAPLLEAEDGIALPPSTEPYGFIAFYLLPYTNKVEVRQPFVLASDSVIVILPEGMKASGEGIVDAGTRTFQGNVFHLFQKTGVAANETLQLTISGKPRATTVSTTPSSQTVWIGVGALGVVLILLGVWFYLRDRQGKEESEALEENPYESEEEVLDAILALDDLHRSGKLSDEVYQKRRAELKALLEEMRRND